MDFIGRFENFEKDLRKVLKKIGIKIKKIPKLRQTRHRYYPKYYGSESVEDIKKLYWEDIEFFDYFFESSSLLKNWIILKLRNNVRGAIKLKQKIINVPLTPKFIKKKLYSFLYPSRA